MSNVASSMRLERDIERDLPRRSSSARRFDAQPRAPDDPVQSAISRARQTRRRRSAEARRRASRARCRAPRRCRRSRRRRPARSSLQIATAEKLRTRRRSCSVPSQSMIVRARCSVPRGIVIASPPMSGLVRSTATSALSCLTAELSSSGACGPSRSASLERNRVPRKYRPSCARPDGPDVATAIEDDERVALFRGRDGGHRRATVGVRM